jgi:protein TonB
LNFDSNKPVLFAEEMPTFKGGEENLFKYLSQIGYPSRARENGISGRVFIKFVVDKNGKVTDVTLLRGIGFGCDEEAMLFVSAMPIGIRVDKTGKMFL